MLQVSELSLHYRTVRGVLRAVDGISFELSHGETLGVVGESGCGKTSMGISIMRMLPKNVERLDGAVLFDGQDIMKLSEPEFRHNIRWKRISMVFQGAMNALNPVLKVGFQVAEPLVVKAGMEKREALQKAKQLFAMVGLPPEYTERYPHELSGGMKQRVVIAMAFALNPELVILDEPTSALDIITQINIINLLKRLKRDLNLSYIFITHDLALASELADKVAIMYGGKIVETGSAEEIYYEPKHPYTQKLLASVPTLRTDKNVEFIPGAPPSLIDPPPGCRFLSRCPFAMEVCKQEPPLIREGGRKVLCWLYK